MLPTGLNIYLAPGITDMRKSVNGLSSIVENLGLDLFTKSLFVFCNRGRTIVKILYWDRNGFCLWYKKLETEKFKWPQTSKEVISISSRQLYLILEGIGILEVGHTEQHYKYVT